MTRGLGALGCDCVRCSGYFSEENMANQSGIVCSQELEAFLATCRDGNVRLVKVRWVGLYLKCQLNFAEHNIRKRARDFTVQNYRIYYSLQYIFQSNIVFRKVSLTPLISFYQSINAMSGILAFRRTS